MWEHHSTPEWPFYTITHSLSAAPLECFGFSWNSIYGRSQALLARCLLVLVAFSPSIQDLSTPPVSYKKGQNKKKSFYSIKKKKILLISLQYCSQDNRPMVIWYRKKIMKIWHFRFFINQCRVKVSSQIGCFCLCFSKAEASETNNSCTSWFIRLIYSPRSTKLLHLSQAWKTFLCSTWTCCNAA